MDDIFCHEFDMIKIAINFMETKTKIISYIKIPKKIYQVGSSLDVHHYSKLK